VRQRPQSGANHAHPEQHCGGEAEPQPGGSGGRHLGEQTFSEGGADLDPDNRTHRSQDSQLV